MWNTPARKLKPVVASMTARLLKSWLLFSPVLAVVLFLWVPWVLASSTWTQNSATLFGYGKQDNTTVSGETVTLASAFISNQLSGTQVNDVSVYDTTQDSDSATLISLGTDPNWRNGVVKYYGTLAANDSSNIQAAVPDNDYTNGNTIDLRITTGGTTGTAVYEWRERTTTDYTSMTFDGINTLTKTGAFAQSRVGDQVLVTGGTGITKGYVTITAVTDDDNVTINTDIGGNVSNVTATVITGTWTQSYTTATTLTELGSLGVTVSFTSGASFTAGDIYQINSWFTEALDAAELASCNIATMDRCGSREFPKKSIEIATNTNLYLVDVANNTMWMRFDNASSNLFDEISSYQSSAFALNGTVYSGQNVGTSSYGGLVEVNFYKDSGKRYRDSDGEGRSGVYKKAIGYRNGTSSFYQVTNILLVNEVVNDVHAAVVSGKTYVAVAADGGVSVINEADGTVVDISVQDNYEYYNVSLQSNGNLYTHMAWSPSYDYSRIYVWYSIPLSDESYLNADFAYRWDNSLFNIGGNSVGNQFRLNKFDILQGSSSIDGSSNILYIGTTNNGFSLLQEKQGDETNGSVKYFTKDYITEEMIGDIRGMWGFWDEDGDSTLANDDTISDLSVKSTDLTVVDGGGTAPQIVDGVRGKAIQFDGSNDYLTQKVYEDETGASFGPTYHGLSLANSQAFYRAQGVDLSPYKGNDSNSTPYMLVLNDSASKTAWGYIGAQDAAEAVGSELTVNGDFSNWTADDPDNFTVNSEDANNYITQSGTAAHFVSDNTTTVNIEQTYTVSAGKLYKFSLTVQNHVTGDVRLWMRDTDNGVTFLQGNMGWDADGTYSAYATIPSGCTNLSIRIYRDSLNGGNDYEMDNWSFKEVTDVGTDGVHIISSRNGSTRNWAGIESGFDYNDSSYTFEVRKTDFQITGDVTLGAWVKLNATSKQYLITKGDDSLAVPSRNSLLFNDATNGFSFQTAASSTSVTSSVGSSPSTGQWYFVVGVRDSANNQQKLYLDGVLADTDSQTGALNDISSQFLIGTRTSHTLDINGTIDEPFVTAEVLTAADILRMWETGCRAMGGTPNEPGGGSANTCDSIPGTHPTNTLAGSQNGVYGVAVDTTSSPNYAYVATSGSGTGAVSKIQLNADKLVDSWTTGSTPALPSNNIDGGLSLLGAGSLIGLGTDSGFSLLAPSYGGIGSFISGTSSGTGYGFDTGASGAIYSTFTPATSGSGTVTHYLRGGSNETMTTGLTPWYQTSSGSDANIALDGSRYIQHKTLLEPSSDGASAPTVSSLALVYDSLPIAPANLAVSTTGYNTTDGYFITLTWDSGDTVVTGGGVAAEASYKLYVGGDKDTGTLLATIPSGTTTYTHTSLSANTSYTYYLYSYGTGSNFSTTSQTLSQSSSPSQVLGLAQDAVNTTQNAISWTWTQVTGAVGYKIYTAVASVINSVSYTANALIQTITSGSTTTWLMEGLQGSTIYQIYVRAYDSSGGEGQASSTASATTDTTQPLSFNLESPGDKTYTSSTRPTFKWKTATDATSGLNKYRLEVDNGETGDFVIDDIATQPSDTSQAAVTVTKNKYTVTYRNFHDADTTNNIIELNLTTSSDWTQAENGGALKEGKRTWKVKAYDRAGNGREETRTLYVDQTRPGVTVTQINDFAVESDSLATFDTTPNLKGKITDNLAGSGTDDQVASGPEQVEVKFEKQTSLGQYEVYSLTTITLDKTYWTSSGQEIGDNTLQTSDKTALFEYQPSAGLPLGVYRVTVVGKDKAGNSGSTSLYVTIRTFQAFTETPEAKELIEELKEATGEETETIEELIKENKVVLPELLAEPSKISEAIGGAVAKLVETWWSVTAGAKGVAAVSGRVLVASGKVIGSVVSGLGQSGKVVLAGYWQSARAAGRRLQQQEGVLLAQGFVNREQNLAEVSAVIFHSTQDAVALASGLQETTVQFVAQAGQASGALGQDVAGGAAGVTRQTQERVGTWLAASQEQTGRSVQQFKQGVRQSAQTSQGITKAALVATADGLEGLEKGTQAVSQDIQTGTQRLSQAVGAGAGQAAAVTGRQLSQAQTTATAVQTVLNEQAQTTSQAVDQATTSLAGSVVSQAQTGQQLLSHQLGTASQFGQEQQARLSAAGSEVASQIQARAFRLALASRAVRESLVRPASDEAQAFLGRVKIGADTFVAIVFDEEPTRISNVTVAERGQDYVVVTWQTNHYATSKVNYGLSTEYGQDIYSGERVKEHRMVLTGLSPDTQYYFEVMSQNKNYAYDAYHTVQTAEE